MNAIKSEDIKLKIRDLTQTTIKTLLVFIHGFRTIYYLHDKNVVNWRELESSIAYAGWPIHAMGIIAKLDNLNLNNKASNGLFSEEMVAAEETIEIFDKFPFEAAASAYAYTIMEEYGNTIVELINPGKLDKRQAWHRSIYGDANLADSKKMDEIRKNLAATFVFQESDIPEYIIEMVVELKKNRNNYIHEGDYQNIDFQRMVEIILAVICFLHLTLLPEDKELSIFPFQDFKHKYTMSNKV